MAALITAVDEENRHLNHLGVKVEKNEKYEEMKAKD
ncbi:hypothetical protein J2T18_004670 [Paenibacillus polymyxa]|nr:hypothetical protein [Paenibacillus polymyxa]